MKSLHCLIANIPQVILVDVLQNILEKTSDIEVVGRVKSYEEALSYVKQNSVDVLIIGMENSNLSNYPDIINLASNLIVVGLFDEGRKIAVYLNDVGSTDVITIIRTLSKLKGAL